MRISALLLVVLVFLAGLVNDVKAQPPSPSVSVSGITVTPDSGGTFVLPIPAPSFTPYTLLLVCPDLNSIYYDGYSGNFLAGGLFMPGSPCPSAGQIRRIIMSGSSVVSESLFATIPSAFPAPVSTLGADMNGDYIAASFTHVWRANRSTGSCSAVTSSALSGIATAVTGRSIFYAAVTGFFPGGPSSIYRIQEGNAVQVASTAGIVAGVHFVSGLALGPDEDSLWAAISGPNPTPSLIKFDRSQIFPPYPAQGFSLIGQPLSDIKFDGAAGVFYTSTSGVDEVWSVNPTNPPTASQLTWFPGTIPWGNSTGLTVNNFPDGLTVYPRNITATAVSVATLEIALHGPPGELGVTGITALDGMPFLFPLGFGTFGLDGRYALPALTFAVVPSMADHVVTFGYARISGGALVALDLTASTLFFDAKPQITEDLNFTAGDEVPEVVWVDIFAGSTFKIKNAGPSTVNVYEALTGGQIFLFSLTAGQSGSWQNTSAVTKTVKVKLIASPPGTDHATISWNIN